MKGQALGRLPAADATVTASPVLRTEPASQSQPSGRVPTGAGASKWTQDQALALCREIEAICPPFGCHVALTGGLLYKDGPRKDADILFYRIRQVAEIDKVGLFHALANIGINQTGGFGWCHKAEYEGRVIDFFFPEEDGEYVSEDEAFDVSVEDFQ